MRANGGSDGHEERHEGDAIIFFGGIEIAIEQPVCFSAQSEMPQIHEQEGKIVKNVDRGKVVIEF